MTTFNNSEMNLLNMYAVDPDATLKDVEKLDNLQRIFGDPRRRVEVSQSANGTQGIELPASSRYSVTVW